MSQCMLISIHSSRIENWEQIVKIKQKKKVYRYSVDRDLNTFGTTWGNFHKDLGTFKSKSIPHTHYISRSNLNTDKMCE